MWGARYFLGDLVFEGGLILVGVKKNDRKMGGGANLGVGEGVLGMAHVSNFTVHVL